MLITYNKQYGTAVQLAWTQKTFDELIGALKTKRCCKRTGEHSFSMFSVLTPQVNSEG